MVKIVVVGAGIGGCSAAYFSRQKMPDANITVFEAGYRLGLIEF